ncbi:four helix bundle protein [Psychroflexus sp. CAK1W]|uniref:four helix bundle protein n=1 Tax=Psychroflexus curvus TaxID=2873595 RepID=UPI001CCB1950|nr:four helix bundle protein [Psychroflexus curvus]MBZ9629101.1 four helix bundle protein [Psychroflexus curvus]
MKTHKDLEVWKESIDFVTELYKVTNEFPKSEQYGLTSQIRRAAISVPSNISEGFARKGIKEKIRFLYIALGSNSEVETQLIIANNLDFVNNEDFESLETNNKNLGKRLINLIRFFERKNNS